MKNQIIITADTLTGDLEMKIEGFNNLEVIGALSLYKESQIRLYSKLPNSKERQENDKIPPVFVRKIDDLNISVRCSGALKEGGLVTTQDIDDFFRRCKIDNDCKVEGQKMTVSLLIELLDKFSTEQIEKLNLHSVSNSVCENCSNQNFNETMGCMNYLQDFKCGNFKQTVL